MVEHRSVESEGLRFDSSWRLRIFSLSHTVSWQDEKNIILDIGGLSKSRPSPLAQRDTHLSARGNIWDSRGKICRDLSGTYAINATPLTDLSPALVAPGLLNSCRLRIARAEALILRAWSWALCKLDVVETCQWARKTEKNFHDWLPSSSSNTCSSFFALLSYIKSWIRPKRIKPIRVSGVLLLTLMEVNYKLWNFLLFMPRGVLYIK